MKTQFIREKKITQKSPLRVWPCAPLLVHWFARLLLAVPRCSCSVLLRAACRIPRRAARCVQNRAHSRILHCSLPAQLSSSLSLIFSVNILSVILIFPRIFSPDFWPISRLALIFLAVLDLLITVELAFSLIFIQWFEWKFLRRRRFGYYVTGWGIVLEEQGLLEGEWIRRSHVV